MAGAAMSVHIEDRELKRALVGIEHDARDLSPALDTIGEMLVSSTLERFEREEDPDGRSWEKSRRAQEQGGQTLSDTGILKGSITHEVFADRVEAGTADIRGAIHQFGGIIKPTTGPWLIFPVAGHFVCVAQVEMPARPYLGITRDDRREAEEILKDHLGVS